MGQYGFINRLLDYKIIRTPWGYVVTNKNGLTLDRFDNYSAAKEYINSLVEVQHGTSKDN